MKPFMLTILLAAVLALRGQQDPLFSQYRTNLFALNPAAAGAAGGHEFRLLYRSQWQAFPGSPRTLTGLYHGAADEKNSFGAMVFADAAGPASRTGLQLGYAFRFGLGQPGSYGQNYLSLGMAAKVTQFALDGGRIYFQQSGDPLVAAQAGNTWAGDVAFGLYMHNERFYAGFSAPNLLRSTLENGQTTPVIGRLYRHYYGLAGMILHYGQVSVEPSVLFKQVEAAPFQIEGNVKFYFMEDRLVAGISYRTDWLISLMAGMQLKRLSFLYTADLMPPHQRSGSLFGPANELSLGWTIGQTDGGKMSRFYREP
jgi:type IX secretion system PorP/SprF family membrane protein